MPDLPYNTRPNPELSLPRKRTTTSATRTPRTRQKACVSCVSAKTRCDLARPTCARCQTRGSRCDYASASEVASSSTPPPDSISTSTTSISPTPVGTISLRWLAAMVPQSTNRPPARPKTLSSTSLYFCSRYMRAYPLQLLSVSSPPPFVHPTQLSPSPMGRLSNATTLVSMYQSHAPGSEDLVATTVANELAQIMDSYQDLDATSCLAAFQSYLLLSMLVFHHFPDHHHKALVTVATFVHLQNLADRSAQLIPLLLSRPGAVSREQYVLSESLRRTIFAACVFDDVWNALAGLPVYVAEELGQLPAPGPKGLWRASEPDWGSLWDAHVSLWTTGRLAPPDLGGEPGMLLEELWGRGVMSEQVREARVDQWLMESDEYAAWIFAICEMGGSGRAAK